MAMAFYVKHYSDRIAVAFRGMPHASMRMAAQYMSVSREVESQKAGAFHNRESGRRRSTKSQRLREFRHG